MYPGTQRVHKGTQCHVTIIYLLRHSAFPMLLDTIAYIQLQTITCMLSVFIVICRKPLARLKAGREYSKTGWSQLCGAVLVFSYVTATVQVANETYLVLAKHCFPGQHSPYPTKHRQRGRQRVTGQLTRNLRRII